MVEIAFYMRIRGKISGPFDLPTLQKLVRRGELSRIHSISSDLTTWITAGQFEELFPMPPKAMEPNPEAPPANSAESFQSQPIEASVNTPYYYTQRGFTVGPVPLKILKALVENGTLRPEDLVWREQAETGSPAAQFPALAPLFAHQPAAMPPNLRNERHQPIGDSLRSAVTAADINARRTGIAAGTLVLVLINLPWFVVDRRAIWWWNLYEARNGISWAMCVTFLVLAAATLCVVGPLTAGVARAVVYLSLTLTAWIFLWIVALNGGSSVNDVASLTVPMALSLLIGTCIFRNTSPQSLVGRIFVGICSGIAALGMIDGIVSMLQDAREAPGIPPGVIIGVILVFIGMLAGLAASVMGFVGLKPMFTKELNTATGIAAAISLVLPGLGIFVAVVSASALLTSRDWPGNPIASPMDRELGNMAVQMATRVLLVVYAFLAVATVGMRELLTVTHFTASRK